MNKVEFRREMRLRLGDVAALRTATASTFHDHIARHEAFQAAGSIALFDPLPSEPAIDLFAHRGNRVFSFPLVRTGELVLVRADHPGALQATAWHAQIREPEFRPEHVVQPAQLDLILVPGVAFTREGARLGRGGGYYDRLLAQLPRRTMKLGICFQLQLVPELTLEAHDQRVDLVITESGTA